MVDYRAGAPKIYCTADDFVVKVDDKIIGSWPDMRQAKAARWAARNAIDLSVSDETMAELIEYATSLKELWTTFDAEIDEDCVDLR